MVSKGSGDVQGRLGPWQGGTGMPHLPGGRVSPEIGEHPGEPVIDLIQGQLPVGGFQDGLWTRKKYRDPQSGPARATGLCALPQLPSAWPLTHLRAEETRCGSMWTRPGVPDGPLRGAGWLQPSQRLKGTRASRAVHLWEEHVNFCCRENGSKGPCPRLGRKAVFLGERGPGVGAVWNLSWFL